MEPAAVLNDFDKEIDIVVYAQRTDTNLKFHPAIPIGRAKMKVPEDTIQIILSLGFEGKWGMTPE